MTGKHAEDWRKFKTPLIDMTLEAGRILMKHYGSLRSIDYKGAIDLVTDADRESEDYVRDRLSREFPDHIVLAEEGENDPELYNKFGRSDSQTSDNYIWVIDPLDGTTNFAHSFPMFSVSIALTRGDEILLGAVYNPYYQELFIGEKGGGATLNGAPLRVSEVDSLEKALVVTGFPYDRRKRVDQLLALVRGFINTSHGFRRCGSAALDLCFVAAGRTEGYWEQGLHPWDAAAGTLILREAGGRVTDYADENHPCPWWQTLATNGRVHAEMMSVIKSIQQGEDQ